MSLCGQSPLFVPTTVNAQIRNIDAVDVAATTINCTNLNINGEAVSTILQNVQSSGPDDTIFSGKVTAGQLKANTSLECGGNITQTSGTTSLQATNVASLTSSGTITQTSGTTSLPATNVTSLAASGTITQTAGTTSLQATTVTSLTTPGTIVQTSGNTTLKDTTIVGTLNAAKTGAGTGAISIGTNAGLTAQTSNAVAIGNGAGSNTQGNYAVAIGLNAGAQTQTVGAIAIGSAAGNSAQGNHSIALGTDSGRTNQGNYCISMGIGAAQTNQGSNAIAIGTSAGASGQGSNSILIGNGAGSTNAHNNTTVLNASGSALNTGGTSRFYVSPVRGAVLQSGYAVLKYDNSTGEVVYGTDQDLSIDGNFTQTGSAATASLKSTTATTLSVTGTSTFANDVVASTKLSQYVPAFLYVAQSGQNLPHGAEQIITFADASTFTQGNPSLTYSSTNYYFTNNSGRARCYIVSYTITFGGGTGGRRHAYIRTSDVAGNYPRGITGSNQDSNNINTAHSYQVATDSNVIRLTGSAPIILANGGFFGIFAYQNVGAGLNALAHATILCV